jgi:long-chain fatty acid transport protein
MGKKIAALLLVCAAGPAAAAGFALKEQSAIDQGASFAGVSARADDPSSLFFNPASMAKLPGYQVSINASVIAPDSDLHQGTGNTTALLGGGPTTGTVGGNGAATEFLPSIYATAAVAPGWHVGLAVTSPFGLVTKYSQASVARYWAETSSLKTINVAPSVAWQALPQLAVGAALNVETAEARLSNAVDFGAIGALNGLGPYGYLPGTKDGIATVKGSDTAVGFQLGLLYEPLPGTRIGVDYRSAMFHHLTGSISFQDVPPLLASSFPGGAAAAKLPEPDIASAGIAQVLGDWTLLGEVTWTHWARFHQLLVTYTGGSSLTMEDWRDSWGVAAGADYRLTDKITLRGGVAWDQTPVADPNRTPRIPDGNRYWLSAGITYRPVPALALSAAYSHIFVSNGAVSLIDGGPGTDNFLRGNLEATFLNSIDIASLQATLAF